MKVFLGGTVAGSKWRDYMMPKLKVDYFNPVVEVWTEEDQKREIYERENSEFCLYVISPKMIGWYSLAEVVDDSFKKNDNTIYCYLPKDDKAEFTEEQINELEHLGKLVQANGAIWKHSLDEVIDFLNSASDLANDALLQQTDQINNVFISYGRRHSLAFARKLYKTLTDRNYDVWFDMNDIPLGVDFQEQIDDGIRKADNFIYVMSPHSINSVYCYKELVLALKYNKRIIPILHVEPQDGATWDKIPKEAGKRNWIYSRQDHDKALELSAKTFKIQEKILEIPENEWKLSDDFKIAFESLVSLLDSHRAYVRSHTILLDKSLTWKNDSYSTQKLLVGKGRTESEVFLERSSQVFKNSTGHHIQPPCLPTDLLAEFIMESKKQGNDKQSNIFINYHVNDAETVSKITYSMAKHNFSSWISSYEIERGVEHNSTSHNGIIKSTSIVFVISKSSLKSDNSKKEFKQAIEYNKHIIPILIEKDLKDFKNLPDLDIDFPKLTELQYIDFTDLTDKIEIEIKDHKDVEAEVESRKEKSPFEKSINELVYDLNSERAYLEIHRKLLVEALEWKEKAQKQSFLLRGFKLENAQTWVRLNKNREQYPPLPIQDEFVLASEVAKGRLRTDVFISYSSKDRDFANNINKELQAAGKITWFDQESISKGVNFEKAINKGISGCDNFVFVISPDSIKSEYCEKEVAYTVSQSKRIITLLAKKTEPANMPEALRSIEWIDFSEGDFEKNFFDLIQTVELDSEHVAKHTLLQQRANEWNEQGQSQDFLLNKTACVTNEKWLASAYETDIKNIFEKSAQLESKKTPTPTSLQIDYIKISRKKINDTLALERKKQRIIILIVGFAAIISLTFGIFGFIYMEKAQKNEKEMKKLIINGVLQDAKIHKSKEEYNDAINKYIYLRDVLKTDTIDVKKEINKCKQLDSIRIIFYNHITLTDSLIETKNIINYIKVDSVYQYLDSLKYEPGKDKIEDRKFHYKDKKRDIVKLNINRAKKYMEVPDRVLYPIAKKLLLNLQSLDKENEEIKKLLKKLS